MKKIDRLFTLLLIFFLMACSSDDISLPNEDERGSDESEELSASREKFLSVTDLVLFCGGATFRPVIWDKERLAPYVTYVDTSNKEHWLFDGFYY